MFINPLLKTDPQKSTASSCFFLNASAAQLLEEITSVNVCVEPLLKIYVFGKRKKRHNVPLETERLNCHNGRGTIIGLHPSIRFHWIEFSVHSVSDFVMKWKAASYFCISNEDIRSQRMTQLLLTGLEEHQFKCCLMSPTNAAWCVAYIRLWWGWTVILKMTHACTLLLRQKAPAFTCVEQPEVKCQNNRLPGLLWNTEPAWWWWFHGSLPSSQGVIVGGWGQSECSRVLELESSLGCEHIYPGNSDWKSTRNIQVLLCTSGDISLNKSRNLRHCVHGMSVMLEDSGYPDYFQHNRW